MFRRPKVSAERPTLNSVLRRAHLKVALVAVVLAGFTLTLVGLLALRAYSEHNLLLVGRSISYTVEAAVVFKDAEAAAESLQLIAEPEEVISARITDRHGNELVYWQNSQSGLLVDVERAASRVLQPEPITLPIIHDGKRVGQLELVGSGSSLVSFLVNGFVLLFVCLLLSAMGTFYLSRRVLVGIVQPLRNLAEVAHTVRYEGSFDERVPPADIAELNELGNDFNELLDELEAWRVHLREENAALTHRASHDSLTGLANRAYFESRLSRVICDAAEQGQRAALLYMDCDHFKRVNDTLGHVMGDEVLKILAARVQGQLRKDDLLARLGGDEFAAIIYPCHQPEDVQRIAANIQRAMAAPMELTSGRTLTVSLSQGVAVFPDHAQNADDLLKHADAAMYEAKQVARGKHRMARHPALQELFEGVEV